MKCIISNVFDFQRDNINVSDLCRDCGISRQAFYNIINNKSEPKVGLAIEIVNYLNAAMSEQGYTDLQYDVNDLWI